MWNIIIIVLLILILIFLWYEKEIKTYIAQWRKEHQTNKVIVLPQKKEEKSTNLPQVISEQLYDRGYEGDVPWTEVIKTSLDPATFTMHKEFVKDVRRFSSGANFTSVTDDNTNSVFTNFMGLRRPQHVPIGPTVRETPDVDETVLQRNHDFRWRTDDSGTYLSFR